MRWDSLLRCLTGDSWVTWTLTSDTNDNPSKLIIMLWVCVYCVHSVWSVLQQKMTLLSDSCIWVTVEIITFSYLSWAAASLWAVITHDVCDVMTVKEFEWLCVFSYVIAVLLKLSFTDHENHYLSSFIITADRDTVSLMWLLTGSSFLIPSQWNRYWFSASQLTQYSDEYHRLIS